jgi:hypothetical protein
MALIRFWVSAVDVVDVEVADVLPGLFEADVRIAHLDEIGLLFRVFYLCLPYMPTFPVRVFDVLVILLLRFFVHFFVRFFSIATLGRSPSTQKQQKRNRCDHSQSANSQP